MSGSGAARALLPPGFIFAKLPFFTERLLRVGRPRTPQPLRWRLLELLLLSGLLIGVGMGIEARLGQPSAQGWAFHAAGLCLMLTFAFPGVVRRLLCRQPVHE